MEPEAGSTVLFDELVSNMQSDVAVGTNAISGTLNFIEGGLAQSGPLAGDGHFIALKFSTSDWDAFDKVEVGLDPSQGSGLVDVKPDPDKNGVFKVTSNSQKFVVKTTKGTDVVTTEYSLADIVLTPAPAVVPDGYVGFDWDSPVTFQDGVTEYNTYTYGSAYQGNYVISLEESPDWSVTGVTFNDTVVPFEKTLSGNDYEVNYKQVTGLDTDNFVAKITMTDGTDTTEISITYTLHTT